MRVLPLLLIVTCSGCDPALMTELNLVRARDLAGTYTGVLEGVSVSNLSDMENPQRQVIVDLDLLHEVTIRATGATTLSIASPIIPPFRAIIVGSGPVAINAEFLEFEGLDFAALKVKQVVFVQYEGEWVVVLQLVRVGIDEQESPSEVCVYQYVSYPARVAAQMNETEAVRYVNTILRLISAAQRS
jgi:hypothetical protein